MSFDIFLSPNLVKLKKKKNQSKTCPERLDITNVAGYGIETQSNNIKSLVPRLLPPRGVFNPILKVC